ncbi:sterol desaturase family protein [Myxococcus xanthus]|uniref:Sterol desaturase family protein n=1 Tax=Myxococcus xanthus TaxID=34 RepID=A0A7Y4MPQ3_MYXXA|nr:sterol desaturase family protein [Myxococcus xanthus]NOJ90518.1 sterol desaturase family protein [Myxococcus xanthus]
MLASDGKWNRLAPRQSLSGRLLLDLPLTPALRINLGKRAGVTGGLLGVLCVCVEFCFLFPHLLVSNDGRAFYVEHLGVFRGILQAAIVATFALGAFSVLTLRSKAHGGIAMLLALVAMLLGGSQAEPLTHQPRALSAGLDYFALELLVLGLLFIPMERLWGLHPQRIFREGWQTDLKHFFVSHVGVQLISFSVMIPVQVFFSWAVRMDFQAHVAAQPVWLQFFEVLLVVDLVSYWVHRAFHQVPWMWKFHAIHHSSQQMDWLASSRSHLVDVLVNRFAGFIPVFLLGFSPAAIYGYLVFVSFHAVYIHANVSHRWPYLRWVFATPEFHHWHHTSDEEGIDKNFAVFLSFIDAIFGTAHLPKHWPSRYGTTKFQPPETYLGQLAYPFQRHEETPYG